MPWTNSQNAANYAQIGACYGTLGNNLPPPTEVFALCNKNNIRQIRLYNPNPSILTALQGDINNISIIVGVANEDIPGIAQNALLAKSWVQNNILKYKNVNFRYISVGNEISPLDNKTANIAPSVAPAMQNIYNAILETGLRTKVKVSTVLSLGILGQSYPPSAGVFKSEIQSSFIDPIVKFLVETQSPFLVNVYPYLTYIGNTNDIRLDYALFRSRSVVVRDGVYDYNNLFDAMVDATYAALEKAGGANLEIVVSETGWVGRWGTDGTSVENARIYNSNLVKSVGKGTPRKPGKAIETYIFDLIDENQKALNLRSIGDYFMLINSLNIPSHLLVK
ncbi:hypothetical protein DH2020_038958 [Rehmannia glutinosa]|uniref:Glucan endo-1,3-beta-D-glucosidase n=1 Tax=Rehmannia glutinosa TaxID=99300 RepID=A0ABR0UX56_REHGL